MKKFTIFVVIVDILVAACFVLFYAIPDFRNKIISIWNNIKQSITNFVSRFKEQMQQLKESKKQFKQEEKSRRKEAKKRAKEIETQERELDEQIDGNSVSVVIVTLFIILIILSRFASALIYGFAEIVEKAEKNQ